MIWLLFISLAAACNALMDSVENEHFFDTKFRDWNKSFWYKRESWNIAKKIFGWKFDAWHVSKSLMVLFMVLAVMFYEPATKYFVQVRGLKFHWLDFMLAASAWTFPFNLFYNRIFKK